MRDVFRIGITHSEFTQSGKAIKGKMEGGISQSLIHILLFKERGATALNLASPPSEVPEQNVLWQLGPR